jgi:hypothetical protein
MANMSSSPHTSEEKNAADDENRGNLMEMKRLGMISIKDGAQ